MNREELEERQLEIANRMKNIIWTVCGDYTLEAKTDVEAFLKSKYIALYDGIKQGAFAKYFEKEKLSMYLVKKVYLGAREDALVAIAQLCMEKAVGDRIARERKGVSSIQKKAYEYVLDHEMDTMVKSEFGRLQLAMMRQGLTGERRCEEKIRKQLDRIEPLEKAADTMEVIRTIDDCYNAWVDPGFEQIHGDLSKVLAVTVEELMEYSWQDFLTEDMYEENFEAYLEQMSQQMTATGQNHAEEKKDEKESSEKRKIVRVSEEDLKKVYTYIELNFGKTYLSPLEEKKINFQLCRGIHADCGLYFTDGILANPVKKNYQLEYAKKQQGKNKYAYYDNHRTVKQNIVILSGILKKAMAMRQEEITILSDRGKICPERLWKIGRSRDAKLFSQICPADGSTFVVDVLIDASGSQRDRTSRVALQGYILSEALSQAGIPHSVFGFCSFWDYTVMHRFRDFDEGREANSRIFEFYASANNRDGLAVRTAGNALLNRPEDQKILIVLSDGRPNDIIVTRPGSKNPTPYFGDYAIKDTATEIRKLRNQGIAVLGVFAGAEKDLLAEQKIFGKDFAYIKDIRNFSRVTGAYLKKQVLNA